jgi:hypothetical protein
MKWSFWGEQHIKVDAFTISNKLAQMIKKERTFISNE